MPICVPPWAARAGASGFRWGGHGPRTPRSALLGLCPSAPILGPVLSHRQSWQTIDGALSACLTGRSYLWLLLLKVNLRLRGTRSLRASHQWSPVPTLLSSIPYWLCKWSYSCSTVHFLAASLQIWLFNLSRDSVSHPLSFSILILCFSQTELDSSLCS